LPHAPRTDPYVHLCAYGSYLGCLTANRWLATCRMRSNACDTLSQSCAWRVLCWPAFPSVPAAPQRMPPPCSPASQLLLRDPTSRLRTSSAMASHLLDADRGRALPPARCGISQLPVHSFLHVMCSSTPAEWPRLALTASHMLRSTFCTVSAPAAYQFRGSIDTPCRSLCTLRGRRCRRLTQHSLPGALLGLPGPVFHRQDCTSFGWRLHKN
jgi:hypothetical protein